MSQKNVEWRGLKAPLLILQLILIFACFQTILYFQTDFKKPHFKANYIAISSEILPHLVLGLNMVAADFLWLRVLQDIDFKESKVVSKGWVFQMEDNITSLDPRFKIVYHVGGLILSVLVHDVEGARIIYEKGVSHFPKDWSLSYKAAYHYLYEVHGCVRAAELFQQSANNGAPSWQAALAGRIYSKLGQYDVAKIVLENALEKFKGTRWEPSIREKLEEVEGKRKAAASDSKSVVELCKH